MVLRALLLFSSLLIVISCSSTGGEELPPDLSALENLHVYPIDSAPLHSVDLQEEARFGDTDDVIIGRITGVQADANGRVYIADDSEKRINVYDPSGAFITSMGGEGKGPGEFEYISNLIVDETHVYAMDFGIRRVNVYSIEQLEFDFSIPLLKEDHQIAELENFYPSGFFVMNSGELLVKYGQPYGRADSDDEERLDLFYKIDREGEIHPDQILKQPTSDAMVFRTDNSVTVWGTPFVAKSIQVLTGNNQIVTNRSDQFLFKIFDADGNYQHAFYYPFVHKQLTRERALNQYENENYRRAIRNYDLPDVWPAIERIVADDEDRLWVSTIIEDEEVYEWWILDTDGELLAQKTWPRTTSVELVKDGYLYLKEENEMGVSEIVKYNLALL